MKKNSQIECLQVFGTEDGEIFRFRFDESSGISPMKLSDVSILNEAGDLIEYRLSVLESDEDATKHPSAFIVSFHLPKHSVPFAVEYEGKLIGALDNQQYHRMVHERDMRMVNPGIDGLYSQWLEYSRSLMKDAKVLEGMRYRPLMSIVVPLFNTPVEFLKDMLDSIKNQIYPYWELVLVNASPDNTDMKAILEGLDDPRIVIIELKKNLGIAGNTNAGIKRTSGDYISFIDHDDVVEPDLLLEYVLYINSHPDVGLLYCDEDSFDYIGGKYFSPLFKPDLNVEFLLTHNYIVHCLTLRSDLIYRIGLSDDAASGAQDYDLTLKAMEQGVEFGHIPRVLYHWRKHSGSTNGGAEGAKPYAEEACVYVLKQHFNRMGVKASISKTDIPYVFNIEYAKRIMDALLVVYYENVDRLKDMLQTFYMCNGADSFDICAVGKAIPHESFVAEKYPHVRFRQVEKNADFVEVINDEIRSSTAETVFLCNDKIRWIKSDSLQVLSDFALQDGVGAVFPKGIYRDGLTSSCGVCVFDGEIMPLNIGFTQNMGGGYLGLAEITSDYSAASPGCLVCRRSVFDEVQGIDNIASDELMSCVDFCFKIRSAGLRIVFVPIVTVINESIPIVAKNLNKSQHNAACAILWNKWGDEWQRDILYNPNVTFSSAYPRLNTEKLPIAKPSPIGKFLRRLRGLLVRSRLS